MEFLHQLFTGWLVLLSVLLGYYPVQSPPVEDTGTTTASVLAVIDGDTIEVLLNGEKERVRYIGVDTPEFNYETGENDCYAQEAKQENQDLVAGKIVRLETDTSDRDKYGRLLRYVYIDDVFVNRHLVQAGMARAIYIKPDVAYYSDFKQVEEAAQAKDAGIWGVCY